METAGTKADGGFDDCVRKALPTSPLSVPFSEQECSTELVFNGDAPSKHSPAPTERLDSKTRIDEKRAQIQIVSPDGMVRSIVGCMDAATDSSPGLVQPVDSACVGSASLSLMELTKRASLMFGVNDPGPVASGRGSGMARASKELIQLSWEVMWRPVQRSWQAAVSELGKL